MSVKKTAYFSRIYGHDYTWREIGNRTENHGVPGSIPGPATSKSPANNRKTKAPDPIARAFGRSHPLCNGPRACYELGQKSHRNADSTVGLVPSRSLFPAFLSPF